MCNEFLSGVKLKSNKCSTKCETFELIFRGKTSKGKIFKGEGY